MVKVQKVEFITYTASIISVEPFSLSIVRKNYIIPCPRLGVLPQPEVKLNKI